MQTAPVFGDYISIYDTARVKIRRRCDLLQEPSCEAALDVNEKPLWTNTLKSLRRGEEFERRKLRASAALEAVVTEKRIALIAETLRHWESRLDAMDAGVSSV